jgi:hypothetical protein
MKIEFQEVEVVLQRSKETEMIDKLMGGVNATKPFRLYRAETGTGHLFLLESDGRIVASSWAYDERSELPRDSRGALLDAHEDTMNPVTSG